MKKLFDSPFKKTINHKILSSVKPLVDVVYKGLNKKTPYAHNANEQLSNTLHMVRYHYTNYMLEICIAVIKDCANKISNNFLSKVCLLSSGSMATRSATPMSDVDLVILYPYQLKEKVFQFRANIVQVLNQFFQNTDCVLVAFQSGRWTYPYDLIDRNIASTGKYLIGNKALYKKYIFGLKDHGCNPLQLFLHHSICRKIDSHWNSQTKMNSKHAAGGRRDIMRIQQMFASLKEKRCTCHEVFELLGHTNVLKQIINNVETIKILNHYQIDHQLFRNFLFLAAKEQRFQNVKFLYQKAELYLTAYFPQKITKKIVKLQKRNTRKEYLSSKDVAMLLRNPELTTIFPYALTTIAEVTENTVEWVIKKSGWLGLMGLIANPRTPANVLHLIADMPGYDNRNLRDQVLKHPNVSNRTLQLLANSDLLFTQMRAKKVLSERNGHSCF